MNVRGFLYTLFAWIGLKFLIPWRMQLAHHSVPEALINAVQSLYEDPSFQVLDWEELSSHDNRKRDLDRAAHYPHTVEAEHESRFSLLPSVFPTQPPSWDLQFADDIVLMTNSAQLC